MLDIGSLLNTPPEKESIKNCFQTKEWKHYDCDSDSEITVVSKSFLDTTKIINVWIDIYKPAIPEKVYLDAKRIVFDLNIDKLFWHSKTMKPSNLALVAIYIASHIHGFDFKNNYNKLIELKGVGREAFGLKRKSYMGLNHYPRIYNMILNCSENILNTMPDKIEDIKKMWKRLEEIT